MSSQRDDSAYDSGDRTRTRLKTAPTEPELGPGMIVGDYRIESKIGEGGMGRVFAAVHPLISKRAAIKVLREELCEDPGTIERFVAEARVVNEIGHPNLVDVFAFGQLADGRHYMVMEWLKGETLHERIQRGGKSSLPDACAVLLPLARALEAAHRAGVVHRDLKPANVFLVDVPGERPLVKLLDFGLAKLLKAETQQLIQTQSGALVGTPMYIAPEQARNQDVDHRADIYALGAVAFEVLTGRPPFVGATPVEVVAMHLVEEPTPPSRFVPEIPKSLSELIVAMLAKDPARRPTLATVQRVLEQVRTGEIAVGHEPSRKRWLWLFAGVLVILAVAIAAAIATSGDELRSVPSARAPGAPQNTAALPAESPSADPSPPVGPATPPVAEPTPPEPAESTEEQVAEVLPEPTAREGEVEKPKAKPRPAPTPTTKVKPVEPREPVPAPVPTASVIELGEEGQRLFVRGKFDAAEAAFKRALAVDRRYAPAYHGLGLIYQRLGKRQKAIEAFRTYLEISPNSKDAEKIRRRLRDLGA